VRPSPAIVVAGPCHSPSRHNAAISAAIGSACRSSTGGLARNRALVDGNKRLALAATVALYGLNGFRLTLSSDEAYDLVVAVASGEIDDVETIAIRLESARQPGADVDCRMKAVGHR
jgi:hypothetical protein